MLPFKILKEPKLIMFQVKIIHNILPTQSSLFRARIAETDVCPLCNLEIQSLKAGTHEGACSRSTLLQHAPGAKLPRLHQRFLAKKYVAQQNFCSRVLLPHIKPASYRGKSVARFCFRGKLPRV